MESATFKVTVFHNSIPKQPSNPEKTGYYIDFTWFLGGKNVSTQANSPYPYVSGATSVLNLFWAEWDPSDKEDEVKVRAMLLW